MQGNINTGLKIALQAFILPKTEEVQLLVEDSNKSKLRMSFSGTIFTKLDMNIMPPDDVILSYFLISCHQ
jgi:hypothetical protein